MISQYIKYPFAGIVVFILLGLAATTRAQAQDYTDVIRAAPESATFSDVSARVDQFFRENPGARGRKQWERWKWYAGRHLDTDGKVGNITARNMEALRHVGLSNQQFPSLARLNGDWNPIGPFAISAPAQNYLGRVNCVAFHPTDVNTLFAGTPGGGLW
ncbi:MAG: hypothetical protein JNM88_18255, partial [Chitinophagaceae bacterium]|nr:hypothetical protein [Chitinophagaceae bacterium]